MTIPFSNIPANTRIPLFYAEIDPSKANSYSGQNARTLILAQKTAAGLGDVNVARICSGKDDAIAQGGQGSMLALMAAKYREADPYGEFWICPLSDDGAAVAAAGSLKFTHVATAAGTLYFYIGDVVVKVAVTAAMTLANLATALAAAINALPDLPVTAAVNGGDPTQVDITARNLGAVMNDLPLALNVKGTAGGELTPAALTATITQMANGATNPSLTTALANLGDAPFDFVLMPYTDTTSLDALKGFFSDSTGRWAPNRQLFGHGWTAFRGNLSAATTLGALRNDQHMTILPENAAPTPAWLWASFVTGTAAVALRADPGRPLQTLALPASVVPPSMANRFSWSDRNALLFSGMSTFVVSDDNTVRLENIITTYLKNGFGQPDDSYLEVETMYQLMFLVRKFKDFVTSTYPRMKLAKDGTRLAPGAAIVTPSVIRGGLIALYRELEYAGYCQQSQLFADNLVVEINANNPNRIDVLLPLDIMAQLRIFAALVQFRI